jgi:hypothetical protein
MELSGEDRPAKCQPERMEWKPAIGRQITRPSLVSTRVVHLQRVESSLGLTQTISDAIESS